MNEYRLKRLGFLDFKWQNSPVKDYNSSSAYNYMILSDFGTNIYNRNDLYIIPISPMVKSLGENNIIGKDFYQKSHLLAEVDKSSLEITKVVGHFPSICSEKRTPQFDFFSHIIDQDTLYINYPTDSLIYVYKYPDELLYTFGYECENINRDYTSSRVIDQKLYDDFDKVGIVTEIKKIPEENLFFRTYVKDMTSKSFGMQVYDLNHNLIDDIEMPPFFKLLGHYKGFLYGITMIPKETDEATLFTLYKIRITKTVV